MITEIFNNNLAILFITGKKKSLSRRDKSKMKGLKETQQDLIVIDQIVQGSVKVEENNKDHLQEIISSLQVMIKTKDKMILH